MKRTTSIVLFASIFAIAVGTFGLSGNSATSLVSAVPQTQEAVGMLGHVEYKLVDKFGDIKQYMQGDNEVVNDGEDCVAQLVFGVGGCVGSAGSFTFIGIGNSTTGTTNPTNQTLADSSDDGVGICAEKGINGDMARRNAVVTLTSAASGATGTIVSIDTATVPFTFDLLNATTVFDSGVFNADYDTPVTNHICNSAVQQDAGTDWDMFARQLLDTNQGITVTDGDSLAVKWTITVG